MLAWWTRWSLGPMNTRLSQPSRRRLGSDGDDEQKFQRQQGGKDGRQHGAHGVEGEHGAGREPVADRLPVAQQGADGENLVEILQ
ncbi:hypothetical protein CSQ96_07995 [Janthinobacterium sp. BJB412]|nr:hypothetical protein CSQ96_07995 [Janthinobacterium sp. BJB412]